MQEGFKGEHRAQEWRSPYQLRKEDRIRRERMKIPVCRNCGVRCTVCAPKFGQPARCCLILASLSDLTYLEPKCDKCGNPLATKNIGLYCKRCLEWKTWTKVFGDKPE